MSYDARQTKLLERLADHMLAEGIAGSSLRALAAAAGTSDRMLLYYFEDKPKIMAATLHHIARRFVTITEAAAVPPAAPAAAAARLAKIMLSDAMKSYGRLWIELAAAAARGDALCRDVGEEIGRGFLGWAETQIDCPPEDRRREAARLLMTVQGMIFLDSVGLEEICETAMPAPRGRTTT